MVIIVTKIKLLALLVKLALPAQHLLKMIDTLVIVTITLMNQ